jgi:ABC-type lipoprotein release transport system permease subunit
MTLALTVLILYTGLVDGYLRNMERGMLDLEVGDIQVHNQRYRDRPSIHELIEDPARLITALKKKGYSASARLLGGGLLATEETSAGVMFRGIQIEGDAKISEIGNHVESGVWLDDKDPAGVVLGRRLAKTLAVATGDELVALGQTTDGTIANDLLTVRGVLKGISDGTDRGGVFMTEDAFRRFFELPEGAHQIVVRRPEETDLNMVATSVRQLALDLDVKTWRELMPTLASMLDSTRGMIQIVFVVVYLVVAILILNAMLMAVFERIREFGVLKALGVSPQFVMKLVLIESGLQTILAVATGVTLSIPGLYYLTRFGIDIGRMGGISVMGIAVDPVWYAVVSSFTFLGPVITLVGLVFVAVLYPALKAARISPVEAMTHQ